MTEEHTRRQRLIGKNVWFLLPFAVSVVHQAMGQDDWNTFRCNAADRLEEMRVIVGSYGIITGRGRGTFEVEIETNHDCPGVCYSSGEVC